MLTLQIHFKEHFLLFLTISYFEMGLIYDHIMRHHTPWSHDLPLHHPVSVSEMFVNIELLNCKVISSSLEIIVFLWWA